MVVVLFGCFIAFLMALVIFLLLDVWFVRHIKENQMTVTDSVVSWFMGVVAATANASMPVAPSLRNILIAQSR